MGGAGRSKKTHALCLVMLDSARTAALTSMASETNDGELLKLAFKPKLVCSICKAREAACSFLSLHLS